MRELIRKVRSEFSCGCKSRRQSITANEVKRNCMKATGKPGARSQQSPWNSEVGPMRPRAAGEGPNEDGCTTSMSIVADKVSDDQAIGAGGADDSATIYAFKNPAFASD